MDNKLIDKRHKSKADLKVSPVINIQEQLERERDFAQSLIKTAPIIIVTLDIKGRVIDFNPFMEKLSGYKIDEMKGKDWFSSFLPGKDHNYIRKVFQKTVCNIETSGTINPILTREGNKIYIEWYNKTLKDKNNKVIGILSIGLDITERLNMQKALCASEIRYRTLFETCPDGVIIADIKTKQFQYANPAFRNLFGYSEKEIPTLGVTDLHPKKTLEHVFREFEAQAKGEKQLAADIPCLKKDGTLIYADINTAPAEIDNRLCNIGFFRDVSEYKKIMENLKESEKKYRELVQSSNSIIIRLLPDGTISFMNKFALEFFAFTNSELIGKKALGTLLPKKDSAGQDLEEMWHDIVRNPEKYASNENENIKKDGERVWISWTNKAIYKHNKLKEILSIGKDITRQKNLEKQLQQSQKLESLGRLAGGIAHDFNNLLNAIIGKASLLQLKLAGRDKKRDYVDEIIAVSEKAAELIEKMLTFSRQKDRESRLINLHFIIEDIMGAFSHNSKNQIQIKKHFNAGNDNVLGDTTQLQMMFLNLLMNAKDAVKNKGDIWIETKNYNVSELKSRELGIAVGNYIYVSISDNGIGIEKEKLSKIFDPFYTTKDFGKGIGLGLSSVYGCIMDHKGHIEVKSKVGKGTIVSIYLPLNKTKKEIETSILKAQDLIRPGV